MSITITKSYRFTLRLGSSKTQNVHLNRALAVENDFLENILRKMKIDANFSVKFFIAYKYITKYNNKNKLTKKKTLNK